MGRQVLIVFIVVSLVVPIPSLACYWDTDTYLFESRRIPSAHAVITGEFVRHSSDYYRWRIAQRDKIERASWTAQDFDDVAVAYEKLGDSEKAIKLIEEKLARWPEFYRYESIANLGTFLIHANRFEEGIEKIDEAIFLNPDAHFGREKYQKYLVEYVIIHLDSKTNEVVLPLAQKDENQMVQSNFARYVMTKHKESGYAGKNGEISRAIKGLRGMIRFGNHSSPILMEALGDLLSEDYAEDAKVLAARAYLRAADGVKDQPMAVALYRDKAEAVLKLQADVELAQVEKELKSEVKKGELFVSQVHANERAWIKAGGDVDQLFSEKYFPDSEPLPDESSNDFAGISIATWISLVALIAILAAHLGFTVWVRPVETKSKNKC